MAKSFLFNIIFLNLFKPLPPLNHLLGTINVNNLQLSRYFSINSLYKGIAPIFVNSLLYGELPFFITNLSIPHNFFISNSNESPP
jgi:hypothetical protein